MYQPTSLAHIPFPMVRRAGSRGAAGMRAGMAADGLAIGSAEARRLASPVSGLRCSLTLIVHIHGPLHILSIFWPSCFSSVDRYVRALFPYWKLICARPLVDLVPQQLHAVAELTPDLLVRMDELPHSRHPSALPWPKNGLYMDGCPRPSEFYSLSHCASCLIGFNHSHSLTPTSQQWV
jgi:hypothetical protein